MKHLLTLLGAGLLLFVAACGGASTSGSGVAVGGGGPPPPITGRQTFPNGGVADYSGTMSLNLPVGSDRAEAVGDLALSIDFSAANDQISGSAENFNVASIGELDGRIFITDGQIQAATSAQSAGFEADVSGSLKGTGLANSLLTGTLAAEFIGTDASTVTGRTFGDVTTSAGIDIFDGTITAARP